MWSEVVFLAVSAVVGALVGLLGTRLAPGACRRFAEWSRSPKRWLLFALGAVFFLLCSAAAFAEGRTVYGILGGGMALVEMIAFLFCRKVAE